MIKTKFKIMYLFLPLVLMFGFLLLSAPKITCKADSIAADYLLPPTVTTGFYYRSRSAGTPGIDGPSPGAYSDDLSADYHISITTNHSTVDGVTSYCELTAFQYTNYSLKQSSSKCFKGIKKLWFDFTPLFNCVDVCGVMQDYELVDFIGIDLSSMFVHRDDYGPYFYTLDSNQLTETNLVTINYNVTTAMPVEQDIHIRYIDNSLNDFTCSAMTVEEFYSIAKATYANYTYTEDNKIRFNVSENITCPECGLIHTTVYTPIYDYNKVNVSIYDCYLLSKRNFFEKMIGRSSSSLLLSARYTYYDDLPVFTKPEYIGNNGYVSKFYDLNHLTDTSRTDIDSKKGTRLCDIDDLSVVLGSTNIYAVSKYMLKTTSSNYILFEADNWADTKFVTIVCCVVLCIAVVIAFIKNKNRR